MIHPTYKNAERLHNKLAEDQRPFFPEETRIIAVFPVNRQVSPEISPGSDNSTPEIALKYRQYHWTTFGNRYSMFKMDARPSVTGSDGPVILLRDHNLLFSGIDHRLNG